MKSTHYISVSELCTHYQIDISFMTRLSEIGLLEFTAIDNDVHIQNAALSDLEKMIRLHRDLEINPEGIDVIFHLQEEMDRLREELRTVKTRLQIFGEM